MYEKIDSKAEIAKRQLVDFGINKKDIITEHMNLTTTVIVLHEYLGMLQL
ncbi:hypothetical protein [Clostridium fungisolvens]|nr:hypothetical protein [Clostridium fungisolvens]